ncbi:MAG: hypothetical protein H0Z33_03325 [Bacillaceae bacterium]|nr:hypothetical protein [Bacillaceae bacterium]
MKDMRLYNVIFPLWMIIFFPPVLFFVLPANLLIDGLVIYLTLKLSGVPVHFNRTFGGLVLRAWVFGFFADIVGGLFLLIMLFVDPERLSEYTIWNSPLTIFMYTIAVLIAGLMIYRFNVYLGRKYGYTEKVVKRLGIAMGVVTVPWVFFVPTSWFY